MLRSLFVALKSGTEYLNYGRHIIQQWGAELFGAAPRSEAFRVLDLGCGPGTDLLNVRKSVREKHGSGSAIELYGIESYGPNVEKCTREGIRTFPADIERDPYPVEDGAMDVVIANQVLEHTKEVFWIFAEVARLLKPGGHFIVGVPNLASLHNRLLLLFGQQPTQIQTLSAHVRGFTKPDMRRFAEEGGFFRLVQFRGSNFYPLPPFLSKPLSRLFPTLAWGSFYLLERTSRTEGSFLECLSGDSNFLETPFFGGPQNPAPARRRSRGRTAGRSKPGKRR